MIWPMKPVATLIIESDVHQLARVREFVAETAFQLTNHMDAIDDLVLALNEAVTNVIVHGYEDTPGTIRVEVGLEQNALFVVLSDQAPAYNPAEAPVPDITLPLDQRKPGGLGVHMMRHLTDTLLYQRTPDGENRLTLIKYIPGDEK